MIRRYQKILVATKILSLENHLDERRGELKKAILKDLHLDLGNRVLFTPSQIHEYKKRINSTGQSHWWPPNLDEVYFLNDVHRGEHSEPTFKVTPRNGSSTRWIANLSIEEILVMRLRYIQSKPCTFVGDL